MKTSTSRHDVVKLFERRKGHLDYRVKRDYVRNGVVSVPCRISSYSDVISPYSVEGLETLEPGFVDYLKTTVDATPLELPIVLNVIENCLSRKEQETIEETIHDDFSYELGMVEKQIRREIQTFFFMLVLLIAMGVVIGLMGEEPEIPREMLFIVFWFAGDTVVDFLFRGGHDLRQEKRLAGRLASIKVIFSKHYEDSSYTDSDVDELVSEIEQDVNKENRVS